MTSRGTPDILFSDHCYRSQSAPRTKTSCTASKNIKPKLHHCPHKPCGSNGYTSRQSLIDHFANKHNGEIVWCDFNKKGCGKPFTHKSNMRRHKNNVHSVPKRSNVPQAPYDCAWCAKHLKGRNDNRWRHINKCKAIDLSPKDKIWLDCTQQKYMYEISMGG